MTAMNIDGIRFEIAELKKHQQTVLRNQERLINRIDTNREYLEVVKTQNYTLKQATENQHKELVAEVGQLRTFVTAVVAVNTVMVALLVLFT